jgi:hypothetical protein
LSRRFTGTGNYFRFAFILGKYLLIAGFIFMQLFCHQQNIVAQDTIPVVKTEKKQFKAEPFRATMLAIALPGLGQFMQSTLTQKNIPSLCGLIRISLIEYLKQTLI